MCAAGTRLKKAFEEVARVLKLSGKQISSLRLRKAF